MNRILSKIVENDAIVHAIEPKSGITAHVDVVGEDVWVETAAEFDMERLKEHNEILECMGFTLIAEEPPVEFEDGRMRHYYEQAYVHVKTPLSVAS